MNTNKYITIKTTILSPIKKVWSFWNTEKSKRDRDFEWTYADVTFKNHGTVTEVIESFIPKRTHSLELQVVRYQNVLDNFKRYVEMQE